MKPGYEVIEVNFEELTALMEQARQGPLGEEDCRKLEAAIQALSHLIEMIGDKDTTISRLRALLAKPTTEKTSKVLEQAGLGATPKGSPSASSSAKPKPGHGRNGAAAYREARRIRIAHTALTSGDRCPRCLKGKVYRQKDPALRIRVIGQAPIEATVYELERMRCNLCGDLFEAEAPEGVGEKKYDETAAAMIALLRYGSGVPFYRLEGLEASLGTPLPSSTQWEIVAETAGVIRPAFDELIRQAAQGEVFYNDDTSMKILALAGRRRAEVKEASAGSNERTGLFTSGIVSTRQGQRVALFFTGWRHAGENFARVLAYRAEGLSPPIQMCDALSRNLPKLPKKLEIMVGNCNAHARRHFVDVTPNFPEQCRFVLESLGQIYGYEAQAEEQGLAPQERLRFHQEHSLPVMNALHGLARGPVRREESRTELGLGLRDRIRPPSLGSPDAVPAPGGGSAGFEHRRARPEESDSASKELPVL